VAIVLPAEGDLVVGDGYQACVADGDAVGIAAEVGQHLGRTAEGRLGIGDPVHLGQLSEPALEGDGVRQGRQLAEELKLTGVEGGLQAFEEEAAEQAREHMNR